MRREVESLLSFDEQAQNFIESPPDDVAAAIIGSSKSENFIGSQFGHYRVVSLLGAGGMGEVYLAEDTRLGRKVALKLLPPQFATNNERKMRFEQEARAASALNHPNIITIHGIEQSENHIFIVTELIDGQTLRERIAGKPLDWREAVKIAVQIADALEAAHSVGVVHRDIKPANVMLRQDGYAKVLDFGLAKLTTKTLSDSEAETKRQLNTKSGIIQGTIAYMSPEQALGERVDARTDIFSFGVLLYEMLAGIQPFGGNSDAAVYNRILNAEPLPVREINAAVPLELEQITSRAMAKKKEERYQTVRDLRLDLRILQNSSNLSSLAGFSIPTSKAKSNFSAIYLLIAAAVIFSTAAIVYFAVIARPTDAPDVAKNLNFTQFTGNGDASFPSLAPDGKTVIFSSRAEGNYNIYFQRVGGENAMNLTKDSPVDDKQAVYSPDGSQIAFRSERTGGGIFLMGATGENVRRISDTGFHPSWSPDGKEIVLSTATFEIPGERYQLPSAIFAVNIASGEKREINTNGDAIQPVWSPNGKHIAFWSLNEKRDIKIVSASSGEPITLTDDSAVNWNPVWSPDGKYLYYASNRGGSMNFWRIPMDDKTGKKSGEAEPFTTPSAYSRHLAFSSDGKITAFVQTATSANIVRAEFDPRTETASKNIVSLTQSGGRFNRSPFVSPDGEFVSFDAVKDKQEDLYVMRRDGSEVRQITNDVHRDRGAYWSPDGKRLSFFSDRSGTFESWTINADGTDLKQITFDGEPYGGLSLWSPDGKQFAQNGFSIDPRIFSTETPITEQTPVKMPAFYGGGDYLQITSWSPNGDKIAGWRVSETPGQMGVAFYSLREQKYTSVADYGESPSWLSDSRRLIFFEKNRIFLHNTATAKTKEILTLPLNEGLQLLDVSPDDRSLYFALRKSESNIWLATLDQDFR